MATTENGTYYPSDYSSVADVPSDMKKMAESIDANKVQKIAGKGLSTNDFTNEYKQKLEDLENYDDTEVKKDISDIKEEQETQNTNIENLQNENTKQNTEISQIKEALINVETEQAKSLHIEDASTVAGVLEVEGNEEQETQEGTDNLAILENKTYTQNGITIDVKNGEASISGTATVDTTIRIGTAYLVSGKTYYVRKTTNGGGYYLQGTSGAQKWIGDGESSFNPSTTGEWGIYASFATNDNANTKVKFIVSEQSGTEWVEGKVQIPSLINPSKIKCLGSNKNLFSENYYRLFSGNQSATKEIINNKDKEIKVTTTANAYSGIFLNTTSEAMQELIEQINGKTVTYSFEAKADTNINLQIGRSSNTKIVNLNNEWQKFDITYENTNTCSIYFYNNSATVTNFYVRKIKLEEGEKATSYSINRTR